MHTRKAVIKKKQKTPSIGKIVEQPELSYAVKGNINWYNDFVKLFGNNN